VTIRRGQEWGTAGPLAAGAPVARTDGEVADLAAAAVAEGTALGEVGLLGGDLHAALGSPPHDEDDLRSGRGIRLPVDLGEVVVDRGDGLVARHLFLAHAVAGAGRRRWARRTIVAMNGTHLGSADLGPRAHPNDGLLDITDGRVPRSQVRAAARRELTGSHLPHPGILERRTASYEVLDERELPIHVDGRLIGAATHFEFRCLPDALVIVV
jgi:hypothetical protein